MWFSHSFRSRTSSRASRNCACPRPPRSRPRLEVLEARAVPAQVSLTVTSLADSGPGTLRTAILAADAGKPSDKFTIGFSVTGVIDLQSPLPDLNNTISVQGPGAGSLTVERAAGASFPSAIVSVDSGQTACLSGLTIANGNAGGIYNVGTLTVANCRVVNNAAPFTSSSGFSPGPGLGGGIDNFGGSLTVSGSAVSGNTASFGGGIFSFGSLTISNSTLSGNVATGFTDPVTHSHIFGHGGGIENDGVMTMASSTVSGNSTDGSARSQRSPLAAAPSAVTTRATQAAASTTSAPPRSKNAPSPATPPGLPAAACSTLPPPR